MATEYAYTMRTFAPLDFQSARRCFSESDRLMVDAKHLMPLLLPISRVMLRQGRLAHTARRGKGDSVGQSAESAKSTVPTEATGGHRDSSSDERVPRPPQSPRPSSPSRPLSLRGFGKSGLSAERRPPAPAVPPMAEVLEDCGVNLFSHHVASRFINRYTGPMPAMDAMLAHARKAYADAHRSIAADDVAQRQNNAQGGGALRPFDLSDGQRPNQLKLMRRVFRWLEEGFRGRVIEVHTLFHEFETLGNISPLRPLSYQGGYLPPHEVCPVGPHFLAFIRLIHERLAAYDSVNVPPRPAAASAAPDRLSAYVPLPPEGQEEARLFVMQCRCLLANLYVRIDPANFSLNKYECSLLKTMEMMISDGVLQGTEHEFDALSDTFMFEGPQSASANNHNLPPQQRGGDGGARLESSSLYQYTPAGTPIISHSRFIPPFLSSNAFSDISPSYELYRLCRYIRPVARRTVLGAQRAAAAGGAIQNKIMDVAMSEPALIDIRRPSFAAFEAALAQRPLVRRWLLVGGDTAASADGAHGRSADAGGLQVLPPRLVASIQQALDAVAGSPTPPDDLARSLAALMVVPPHLTRGAFVDGAKFLDACEAEVSALLSNSPRPPPPPQDPDAADPLMATLRFKLHPAYLPKPLGMPEADAICIANGEERRLASLDRRDRCVKESRANVDMLRAIRRLRFPDNVFNDPNVLTQLIYDLMPDHPIDIRMLRTFLPPEAQFGATFERKMITHNPHLFVDLTPVNWQRLQFQRADAGGPGAIDYDSLPDEELAQLFITSVKGRLSRNDLPESSWEDPAYSGAKVFNNTGRRFANAIVRRFGSKENFFLRFPEYFIYLGDRPDASRGADPVFKLVRSAATDEAFMNMFPRRR